MFLTCCGSPCAACVSSGPGLVSLLRCAPPQRPETGERAAAVLSSLSLLLGVVAVLGVVVVELLLLSH